MAKANVELISTLRIAADNLSNGYLYQWGHHGSCNCGNLLQAATNLSKSEIFKYAQSGDGEWTELAEDFCGIVEAPFQFLIAKLNDLGLNPVDIHNIEYLSDKKVLVNLEGGFRHLQRNQRQDVIDYFRAFANMLEDQLENEYIKAAVEEASLLEFH